MSATESEFGKGFLYPLALFVGHAMELTRMIRSYAKMAESRPDLFSSDSAASLWLNGASDHLYEFDPDAAPEALRGRCRALRDEARGKRCPIRNEEEIGVDGAFRLVAEAEAIFFELDVLNGVEAVKAQYT